MARLIKFIGTIVFCWIISHNCWANDDLPKLSQDDAYLWKSILSEATFNHDYDGYIRQKKNIQYSFLDYEIRRYKRHKIAGTITAALGSIALSTSVAATIIGVAAYKSVEDCEEQNRNREGDSFGLDLCGLGYVLATGFFIGAVATAVGGTILLMSGIHKLKVAKRILPRLNTLKRSGNTSLEFQGFTLRGNGDAKLFGVSFVF